MTIYLRDSQTGVTTQVDMPTLDTMGPRERYAWENANRCGLTLTTSQLWHAQHEDQCERCRGDREIAHARDKQADLYEREAANWRLNIGNLLDDLKSEKVQDADPLEVVRRIQKYLTTTQSRSKRIRKGSV